MTGPPYDECVIPADQLAGRYGRDVAEDRVDEMLADGTYFDAVKRHFGRLTDAAWDLLAAEGDEPRGPDEDQP
jgi:hypothetical protein